MRVLLQFSDAAIDSRGKRYEEVVENIRNRVRPTGRELKRRILQVSSIELDNLIRKFARRGFMPPAYLRVARAEMVVKAIAAREMRVKQ